jgi:hypothetical protein
VFLYDETDAAASTSQLPKIRSFAAFESLSASNADLQQESFRRAVKGYFENGGSACYVASLGPKSGSVDENAIRGIIDANPGCTLISYPQGGDGFSIVPIAEVVELDEAIAKANDAFAKAALKAAEAAAAAVKEEVQKNGSNLNEQVSKQAIEDALAAEKEADKALHKAMDDALSEVEGRDEALKKHNLREVFLTNMKASRANLRKHSARMALQAATQAVGAARAKEKLTALDQLAATALAARVE